MRLPHVCSFAVGVCSVFAILWLPGRLEAAEWDPDENVLRRAGVATDDRGLLAFFRNRAGNDEDLLRLDVLVRQLGSRSFKVREEAVKQLVRLGPAAEEALRAALRSPDGEIVKRAKSALEQIS